MTSKEYLRMTPEERTKYLIDKWGSVLDYTKTPIPLSACVLLESKPYPALESQEGVHFLLTKKRFNVDDSNRDKVLDYLFKKSID